MNIKINVRLMTRRAQIGILLISISSMVHSGQGVIPAGPLGGTDISQALLPPPGFYGSWYGAMGTAKRWFESDGSTSALSANILGSGFGVAVVYPIKIFDGAIMSTIGSGYQRTCAQGECSRGGRDIYADLFFWSRFFPAYTDNKWPEEKVKIPYGVAIAFGLGIQFPTGQYSSGSKANVGSNVYDFAPSVAVTYTTPSLLGEYFGQATEYSGRMFVNNYTENHVSDYQSGRMLSLDFALTQRHNRWQYGLAGTGLYQVEDDVVKGKNIGNRTKYLQPGVIVSYNFILDGKASSVTAKLLSAVDGRNTVSATSFYLRLVTEL